MSVLATMRADNDLDRIPQLAIALRAQLPDDDRDYTMHHHRKGQLVFALRGSVICEVPSGLWMVPPQCGVWIPGGTPHAMRGTAGTELYLLLVEPAAAALPAHCCSLTLTPLLREMILHLAEMPQAYQENSGTARLVGVLLEQLVEMKADTFYFPISANHRIHRIVNALIRNPADRRTVRDWAKSLAISERTLTRLVLRETGMSFGCWRNQFQIIVALKWLYSGVQVQRIAVDLGYESVSAFITMFKKVLGKPPSRYLIDTASTSFRKD